MVMLALVAAIVLWLGIWLVTTWLVRAKARRIEHSGDVVSQQVHDLQRLLLICLGAVFGALMVAAAAAGALAGASHQSHHSHGVSGAQAAVAILAMVAVLVPLVLIVRTVRSSLARVRDIPLRSPDRGRQLLAGLVVGIGYAAIIIVGMLLAPRRGTGHVIAVAAVYGIAVLVWVSLLAPLTIVMLRTTAMPEGLNDRMHSLADKIGVRVRGFRVVKGRNQKIANAAQIGTVPGMRYVLVTDYAMDHLTQQQLEAVVAHELGHARRHHVLIKLGAVLGVWAVLEAIIVVVSHRAGHGAAGLLVLPVVVAIPVGMILIQGMVGVRLEKSADNVAARHLGAAHLADALEQLGELNDTKKDTGRAWSLITQHPGLQTRVDHLRDAADEPPAGGHPRRNRAAVNAASTTITRNGARRQTATVPTASPARRGPSNFRCLPSATASTTTSADRSATGISSTIRRMCRWSSTRAGTR